MAGNENIDRRAVACASCAFGVAFDGSAGRLKGLMTCRRFPPTCMEPVADNSEAAVSNVPLVYPDHFCGEWIARADWLRVAETRGGEKG